MLKLALPQLTPIWLNREGGLKKVIERLNRLRKKALSLLSFRKALFRVIPFGSTGRAEQLLMTLSKKRFLHIIQTKLSQ